MNRLKELEVPEKEKESLAQFSDLVNVNYFSGTIYKVQDELLASDGYKLWSE